MHALERPQLPRIGALALGAVLLAIVVLLLAASRVGDIGMSSNTASSAPAPTTAISHAGPASSNWLMSPFASPFHVVLPWSAPTGR